MDGARRGGAGSEPTAADSDDAECAAGGGCPAARTPTSDAGRRRTAGMNSLLILGRAAPVRAWRCLARPHQVRLQRVRTGALTQPFHRPHRSECGCRRRDGRGPQGAVRTQPPGRGISSRPANQTIGGRCARRRVDLRGRPSADAEKAKSKSKLIAGEAADSSRCATAGRGLQAHITVPREHDVTERSESRTGCAWSRYAELKKELDAVECGTVAGRRRSELSRVNTYAAVRP